MKNEWIGFWSGGERRRGTCDFVLWVLATVLRIMESIEVEDEAEVEHGRLISNVYESYIFQRQKNWVPAEHLKLRNTLLLCREYLSRILYGSTGLDGRQVLYDYWSWQTQAPNIGTSYNCFLRHRKQEQNMISTNLVIAYAAGLQIHIHTLYGERQIVPPMRESSLPNSTKDYLMN